MTEALATLFEGKEIRAIEQNGDLWIPLADIAAAWGIDRSTPDKIIERNADVFAGLYSSVLDTMSTPMSCLNERGLYLMMGKISASRLKNKDARAAIIRFQVWVPELIQKYRKGEIRQTPQIPELDQELARARYLARETGGDLAAFQAIALKRCGLEDYAPALNISPIVHGEAGQWLNATQIGLRCGHSPREVNHFLEWHKFQYKDQAGLWRLTDLGEQYGEEFWIETTSRHREVRIRWREDILIASGLIKEQPGQTTLTPARA